MNDETDPIRRFFAHRLTVALTHVFCPILAAGMTFYLLWLTSNDASPLRPYLLGATGIALGTAALGIGSILRNRRDRWFFLLTGLAVFGYVTLFVLSMIQGRWDNVPEWAFGGPGILLTLGCVLPAGVSSLWWLCAAPFPKCKSMAQDFGFSLLFFMVYLLFGGLAINLLSTRDFGTHTVVLAIMLAACVLLGWLFHILGLAWEIHRKVSADRAIYRLSMRIATVLVMPLLGLMLNAQIPFPTDFQNVWCYALTLLTATVLLLPTGSGRKAVAIVFLRWAMLPFTLYFFVLFLPFVPLALPGVFFFGAGFLVLAPTFLLWAHITALHDSAEAVPRRRLRRALAVLGLAVIPAVFLGMTECDRATTRTLIEAIATPDYTSGADTLPLSEARARRAARTVLAYESNATIPLLSLWCEVRIFDGHHPRQDVVDALAARFGTPEKRKTEFFGSIFRPSGTDRTARRRSDTNWTTDGIAATTIRGAGTRNPTAVLTVEACAGREFNAPITLADGVWITGLRLKLPEGGPWKTATRRDRRAAMWVYERLVEHRIDPALLTLDTPTSGRLRVFPLTKPREVEIDLLMPRADWCAVPLKVGTADVRIPGAAEPAPVETDGRKAVTVLFIGTEATAPLPEAGLYVMGGPTISVSETPPQTFTWTGHVDTLRALRFAQGYAYAHGLRPTAATFVGHGWKKDKAALLPEPPRRSLPLLPPDDPWQIGAQAWQLAEAMTHNQTLPYRPEIRALAERCGVLTPTEAYIVVETDLQEKALAAKDRAVRNAHLAFDIVQTDTPVRQSAPGILTLTLCLLLFAFFLKRRKAHR